MKRVIHELMIRDEGLPTQRITLRSRVRKPSCRSDSFADYQYQESTLPSTPTAKSVSDYLNVLIESHEYALASVVGWDWVNYEG